MDRFPALLALGFSLIMLFSCSGDPGKISVTMTYEPDNAEPLRDSVEGFVFVVKYDSTPADANEETVPFAYPDNCFRDSDENNQADCFVRDCNVFDPDEKNRFKLDVGFDESVPENGIFTLEACGVGERTGNNLDILVFGESEPIENRDGAPPTDIELKSLAAEGGTNCQDIPQEFCS